MKIGISTSTFFNTIAMESMFDLLHNMRVDTTEVCLNTFSEYEKPFVDNLAMLKGGMNVVAVSPLATQFEPQLFSPNMRVRTDAEIIFRKICYACFAFNAKYYTFRGQINLDGAKDFDFNRIAQRYAQLSDIAASYGVSLSLRNMRWSNAATPDYFKKLLEMCPRLFATFDLYNAECAGYELRDFLDVCAPQRISHIDIADVLKGDLRLPGRGKYNFERFFNELDRRKIIAPVLISVSSDCYADFVQVRDSFDHLNGTYLKIKV